MVSEEESQKSKKQATDKGKAVVNYPPVEHLLYPHGLSKKDQERQYKCFLDIFKRLQIDIPFFEALEQMTTYDKFVKVMMAMLN